MAKTNTAMFTLLEDADLLEAVFCPVCNKEHPFDAVGTGA